MKTIASKEDVRELVEQLLATPTNELAEQMQKCNYSEDPQPVIEPVICIGALWSDASNLPRNLFRIARSELERRGLGKPAFTLK